VEDNSQICSNHPEMKSSWTITVQKKHQYTRKKGRRPKGSTQAASENKKKGKLAALNHATTVRSRYRDGRKLMVAHPGPNPP
jgi:hypothetical protein